MQWDDQKLLLDSTIGSSQAQMYPASLAYRKSFLKHVLEQLANCATEVHDDMYEAYAALMTEVPTDERYCYKSYRLQGGQFVTLKESTSMISGGTTGLNTWQAGFQLAEWAMENKHLLAGKHVLELGSGLGFTGLAVLFECQPKSFIYSDCHATVLQLLADNLQLNSELLDSCRSKTDETCSMADAHSPGGTTMGTDRRECSERCCHGDSTENAHANSTGTSSQNANRCCECNSLKLNLPLPANDCRQLDVCVPKCLSSCDLKQRGSQCGSTCLRAEDKSDENSCRTETGSTGELFASDLGLGWNVKVTGVDKDVPIVVLGGQESMMLAQLDWEKVSVESLKTAFSQVEVILAADVVYDASIIPALVQVLQTLLQPDLTRGQHRVAYIASTVRNGSTRDSFLQALGEATIRAVLLEGPHAHVFHYDRSVPIEVLQLDMLHQPPLT